MNSHNADFDETAGLWPMHAQTSTGEYLHQMWSRRSFAVAMPIEETRASHQDTLLGNAWHLGNPLLQMGVFYLVFSVFLDADRGIDNYLLWLAVGVFAYGLTARSVLAGATSITANIGLMRAVRFPRALLPFSSVLSRLLTYGFEIGVMCLIAVLTGAGLTTRLLAIPIVLCIHTAFNLGMAYVAARLNDSYRDVQQLIPFVFRLLMYISGVMFPIREYIDKETTNPTIRRIVELNPMVQLLDLYRWVFLGTPVDVFRTAELVLIAALTLVFGFRYFRVNELSYGRA